MPTEYRSALLSPPDTVDSAHDFLVDVLDRRPDITAAERMTIETVVSELITNVIQHNADRTVRCDLLVRVEPHLFTIETTDTGRAANAESGTPEMPSETAEHGRGLALLNLLAGVEYVRVSDRNRWVLSVPRQREGGRDRG